MMVVNMQAKRHILMFHIGEREFQLGTDDLDDVFSQVWFMDFLGISKSRSVIERVDSPREQPNEYRELALEQQRQLRQLQMQLMEMQQQVQRPVQPMQQVQQPVQQVQPQPMAPPPRQQQPSQQLGAGPRGKIPSNPAMDLNPNQMRQDILESLSPEMQAEWMAKWGITS